MRVERNRASWISVAPVARRPGRHLRRGGRLLPRGSCPYAGTTRIRFEGLPRPIFSGQRRLSPLSGHPLDLAIIRKVPPVGQGCGLMPEEAVPPAASGRPIYWFTQQQERSALYPKFRQIRLEKRGGQLFDVQYTTP